MDDSRWVFLTDRGDVFGASGHYSLIYGNLRRAEKYQVFCSDLSERQCIDYANVNFNSCNLLNLIYGKTYWVADPILSEPVRYYELVELRELALKANVDMLRRYEASVEHYRDCLEQTGTFDDIFDLILDPEICTGVVLDLEA